MSVFRFLYDAEPILKSLDNPLFELRKIVSSNPLEKNSFTLKPTLFYWAVSALGHVIVLMPIMMWNVRENNIVAIFSVPFFCIACILLSILARQHCDMKKLYSRTIFIEGGLDFTSSRLRMDAILVIMLPFVISIAISICSLARSLFLTTEETSTPVENQFIAFFLFILIPISTVLFCVVLQKYFGLFKVSIVDVWYRALPDRDQKLFDAEIGKKPSLHWRYDLSLLGYIVNRAVVNRFFSIDKEVNNLNLTAIFTYFSPILSSFLTLLFLPLFNSMVSSKLCILESNKIPFAMAVVCWMALSISYFLFFVRRDFFKKKIIIDSHTLNPVARAFFSDVNKLKKDYLYQPGKKVFAIVVLLLLPVYFDYLGVFETDLLKSKACSSKESLDYKVNLKIDFSLKNY